MDRNYLRSSASAMLARSTIIPFAVPPAWASGCVDGARSRSSVCLRRGGPARGPRDDLRRRARERPSRADRTALRPQDRM